MKEEILTGMLLLGVVAGFAQRPVTREQADRMVSDTIAARGIAQWMIGIHKEKSSTSGQGGFLYFVYEYGEDLHPTALYLAFSADGECRSWVAETPDGKDLDEWELCTNLPQPESEALFDFSVWKERSSAVPRQNKVGGNSPQNYAVIISGGIDSSLNNVRYWNNCSAVYSTLVYVYGYDPGNVYVLMSDGNNPGIDAHRMVRVELGMGINDGEHFSGDYRKSYFSSPLDLDSNGTEDIQYAATRSNISIVFDLLAERVQAEDHVFIFVTDHGGNDSTGNGECTISLWNKTRITTLEFAEEIEKLPARTINIMMAQCYSGAFIAPLAGEGRVIATACHADSTSKAHFLSQYDEFVLHWVSAARGSTPENTPVDADADNDGWVSMHEIFLYAKRNDSLDKSPQYAAWPGNLGDYLSLGGLDACTGTSLANTIFNADRTVSDCSIEVSHSTVESGKKLVLDHDISTELGLGFSMEAGSELEIK